MSEIGNKVGFWVWFSLAYADLLMYVDKKFLKYYYKLDDYIHINYDLCLDDFASNFWTTFDNYNYYEKLVAYFVDTNDSLTDKPDTLFSYYFSKWCFFSGLAIWYFIIGLTLCALLSALFSKKIKFIYYYLKCQNEVENNLSNYCDINRLSVLFIFFFNIFITSVISEYFLIYNLYLFYFFLSLNVAEIIVYLFTFNINLFVFIKGTLDDINIFFVEIFDSVSLLTFTSRLLLQFLRLVICIIVFFNMHILGHELVLLINDYYLNDTSVEPSSYSFVFFKTIVEYLDMIMNFCTQYSIFIIVVMWLLPFLFSFIKKFLKIKNV